MIIEKKYGVYYRSLPATLTSHIAKDRHMKFTKDGLHEFDAGHKCPRLTVIVEPTGDQEVDKRRLKDLEHLLDRLEKTNSIVGFVT